jgi:hypothetical protein
MIEVRFDNLEEIKRVYDPVAVQKATFSAVKQLHNKAATNVSKAIRSRYNIKAARVKLALKKRMRTQGGTPSGFLIYEDGRISLRHFAVGGSSAGRGNQPVRRSARGKRRGVRVRVVKNRPPHVVPGAFWGRGKAGKAIGAGEQQIFQRTGVTRSRPRYKGDEKLRKLTGPSVAHMARGKAGLDEVNQLMSQQADKVLASNLDHFLAKKIGLR